MGRQFPSAEGTGPTVRRPTGRRSGPRLSALRYPLFGNAKGSNRQFGRKPAGMRRAATLPHAQRSDGENYDAKICAPNSPPSCPALLYSPETSPTGVRGHHRHIIIAWKRLREASMPWQEVSIVDQRREFVQLAMQEG